MYRSLRPWSYQSLRATSRHASAASLTDGPPDRLAARRIRELIGCRSDVQVADLVVEVRDGMALLHGGVAAETDGHEAARLAQAVVGVTRVEPRFHVCPILVAEAALRDRGPVAR